MANYLGQSNCGFKGSKNYQVVSERVALLLLIFWSKSWSLTVVVTDNLKCLSDHVFAHASVDFIDACETLCKELLKYMKIAKKFKEKLKLADLEKEDLIVRLDGSNKKNEFLRSQISSQDEKMKSLE